MQAVNWAWFEIPILIGHGQGRLVSHITCNVNGSMQVIQSDVLKTLDLYYLIRVDNYTCDIGPNVFAKDGEKNNISWSIFTLFYIQYSLSTFTPSFTQHIFKILPM